MTFAAQCLYTVVAEVDIRYVERYILGVRTMGGCIMRGSIPLPPYQGNRPIDNGHRNSESMIAVYSRLWLSVTINQHSTQSLVANAKRLAVTSDVRF